jgi:hypothetical protein
MPRERPNKAWLPREAQDIQGSSEKVHVKDVNARTFPERSGIFFSEQRV